MAKIALIESKPSRNDYVRLFDNQFDFEQFQLCSDPTIKKVLKRDCDIDINIDDIQELLLPIWSSKTETARRLQQRLFRIFGFAKIKKWYEKDNPALWTGGLKEIMSDPYKI